jgi:hypothetical protein
MNHDIASNKPGSFCEPSASAPAPAERKRWSSSTGPLPPPPPGVPMMNRDQAAAFMGVGHTTWVTWERSGISKLPRYREGAGGGYPVLYAAADVAAFKEEHRKRSEPHPDPERPGVIRVPVSGDCPGGVAIIDAEDLPKVQGRNFNYAYRGEPKSYEVILCMKGHRRVPLKRIIMGVDGIEHKDRLVCCINGDPLDLRRSNLVVRSRAEVTVARPKFSARPGRAPTSAYKGVHWDAKRRIWIAQIGSREQHRGLGRFRDEAQAAAAYDAAARELHGPAAALNFPDGKVPEPTFLAPDGTIVREKVPYTVTPRLPAPPPGRTMLTRDQAAAVMEVSRETFGKWINDGVVSIPRYRARAATGTPILYDAEDVRALRERLENVGKPYPDPHPARAGVWRVPLRTLAGYVEALVDEADMPIVQGCKWQYATHGGSRLDRGVVIQTGPDGTPATHLKRLILGLVDAGPNVRIGHANGNPLDCRRANLVVGGVAQVTRAQYKILHRSGRPTSSRFKGVQWSDQYGSWLAVIRVEDVPKKIGRFDEEEDAAEAYDEAAREVWGLQARVNFPRPGERPSAAAPMAPADLLDGEGGPAARMPGRPREFELAASGDGGVVLSWRSANAAASAGVTFAISRRLPGQREFLRIGTAPGTTADARRATFTDSTVPIAELAETGEAAEYLIHPARLTTPGPESAVLTVTFDRDGKPEFAARTAKAA